MCHVNLNDCNCPCHEDDSIIHCIPCCGGESEEILEESSEDA